MEDRLAEPSPELIRAMARIAGDVLVLGAGGKMGPSLAHLAANAMAASGRGGRVVAVARFTAPGLADQLRAWGVETIAADLLDDAALGRLPDAPYVVYMAGQKFGTSDGNQHGTWAMNAYVPGRVALRYREANLVVFSSGNVYPLVPVSSGGATEETPPDPVGEYAQSVLGRERLFEHFSRQHGTPITLLRLNYAIELRYGVLLDIASAVWAGQPIDLRMGCTNVIWQGDANEIALRSLLLAESPPRVLNLTGPETVSIRWLASRFGDLFGRTPSFVHQEAETALLSNAGACQRLFGYPRVSLGEMVEWTAEWVRSGGPTLGKSTHFQEREGRF